METNSSDAHQALLSDKALDAVARHLYGEDEYDALTDLAIKDAYRNKARALLQLAVDAGAAE